MDVDTGRAQPSQDRAIEEAVRREQGRLRRFIRTRVADDADSEDILQEVFGELIAAYRRLESIERVSAWLFRVARNKITDFYRKRNPERRRVTDDDGIAEALDTLRPDWSATPEALLSRDALWDAVEAVLDELPQPQRQAFVWHTFDGISFREMSERTGASENALRLRKHHATRALRARLARFSDARSDGSSTQKREGANLAVLGEHV